MRSIGMWLAMLQCAIGDNNNTLLAKIELNITWRRVTVRPHARQAYRHHDSIEQFLHH